MPWGDDSRGEGVAADGRVRAVVTRGRADFIAVDPSVRRLPADELSAAIVTALNAALSEPLPSAADEVPSLALLEGRLREVQERAQQMMDTISRSMAETMAGVYERSRMTGDPSSQGLGIVLEEAQRTLAAASRHLHGAADLRGEGTAAEGAVQAEVVAGRRVRALEFTERVTGMSGEESRSPWSQRSTRRWPTWSAEAATPVRPEWTVRRSPHGYVKCAG